MGYKLYEGNRHSRVAGIHRCLIKSWTPASGSDEDKMNY